MNDVEAEVTSFVHRWAEAIVANDVTQMDQFVTEDWILIDKPGMIGREGFHAAVASGTLEHTSMTHDVIAVRPLGPDVALAVTHGRNTGMFQGEPIEADEWTCDVLIRTDDGWRCTLTQLTPREARLE